MSNIITAKDRISIFSHFDIDGIIDDYVILYLKGLREVSEKIIFVSDCEISAKEKGEISELCSDIVDKKHGEYDFGSHKIGLNLLKNKYPNELNSAKEIIFVNDSCYLIKSLSPIFEKMNERDLDFWGMAESFQYQHNHVHSYFFVLRPLAFKSKVFSDFINSITKEDSVNQVIEKYEIGLTRVMTKSGFKIGSFFGKMFFKDIGNKEILTRLITEGYPFLKIRNLVSGNYFTIYEFENFLSEPLLKVIRANIARRIGYKTLFNSYKILGGYSKHFFHKKLFLVRIKNGKLSIKIFGIQIFKINLGLH